MYFYFVPLHLILIKIFRRKDYKKRSYTGKVCKISRLAEFGFGKSRWGIRTSAFSSDHVFFTPKLFFCRRPYWRNDQSRNFENRWRNYWKQNRLRLRRGKIRLSRITAEREKSFEYWRNGLRGKAKRFRFGKLSGKMSERTPERKKRFDSRLLFRRKTSENRSAQTDFRKTEFVENRFKNEDFTNQTKTEKLLGGMCVVVFKQNF